MMVDAQKREKMEKLIRVSVFLAALNSLTASSREKMTFPS
jgi:hypothetical protein